MHIDLTLRRSQELANILRMTAKASFWFVSSFLVLQLGRLIAGVVNGKIMLVL